MSPLLRSLGLGTHPKICVISKLCQSITFIFKVTQVAGGSLTASRLLIKTNKSFLSRCCLNQTNSLISLPKQGVHTVFHWLGGRHRTFQTICTISLVFLTFLFCLFRCKEVSVTSISIINGFFFDIFELFLLIGPETKREDFVMSSKYLYIC